MSDKQNHFPPLPVDTTSSRLGFTTMEALVVCATLLIVGAIGYSVFKVMNGRAQRQNALTSMRALGGAIGTYCNQNNGMLPAEDAQGNDSWKNAAKPEAKDVWYNAIPHAMGRKSVGDFVDSPQAFYTKESPLFIPGADYPESDKKLIRPMFAIAMNTKLHRKEANLESPRTKLADILNQSKTVVFLEQGLPGEKPTLEVQTKKDYDGSPKGSAKSFVGRYNGEGILVFADGHAEAADAKSVLTETGRFPFPQTEWVWTCNPDDDPNKGSGSSGKAEK